MRIRANETQAIIIDMQERLMPAMGHAAFCEERAGVLLRGLATLEIPTLLSQQYTKGLGATLPSITEAAGTTDFYEKRAFSCMQVPAIAEAVRANERDNVLIAGVEAHVCVMQTCLDLLDMGMRPILVADCIDSRHEYDLENALRRAAVEGICVTTAEAVLFELLEDAADPRFKAISSIVK